MTYLVENTDIELIINFTEIKIKRRWIPSGTNKCSKSLILDLLNSIDLTSIDQIYNYGMEYYLCQSTCGLGYFYRNGYLSIEYINPDLDYGTPDDKDREEILESLSEGINHFKNLLK